MKREILKSGTPWEDIVGYSRALKIGNVIEVAGTTAVDGNQVIGLGNAYEQAYFIFSKIEKCLTHFGSSMKDVVRTRMYVTDISQWEEIGRAHGQFFIGINPVATMVEVSRLISPDLLVEIEVTAVVP